MRPSAVVTEEEALVSSRPCRSVGPDSSFIRYLCLLAGLGVVDTTTFSNFFLLVTRVSESLVYCLDLPMTPTPKATFPPLVLTLLVFLVSLIGFCCSVSALTGL